MAKLCSRMFFVSRLQFNRFFSSSTTAFPRRVVVTGLGMLTPLGCGVETTWKRLIEGRCAIRAISPEDLKMNGFDRETQLHAYDQLTSKVAAIVPCGTNPGDFNEELWLNSKDHRSIARFIGYALCAAEEALSDAKWAPSEQEQKEMTGVSIGGGTGSISDILDAAQMVCEKRLRRLSPFFIPRILINMASGHVSMRYGFQGPNHAAVTACATGAHSIGDAVRMIQFGDSDVMVAGGTESSIDALSIAGFCRSRALTTKYNSCPQEASRPFDCGRDGFVIGEGSGILVLEELVHAKNRGAKIYAEVRGYGMSGDAHHITQPHMDGRGAILAMTRALKQSGLHPDQVDYVNAHATSTPLGDAIEANAIKSVFSDHATSGSLALSSTKVKFSFYFVFSSTFFKMGTHGSSSGRKKSRSYDYDEFDTPDSSPDRSSRKQREHSRRSHHQSSSRHLDDSDSSGKSDGGGKKSSSRNITEEEIADYLAKKAQKKALRVAKKLKSQTVSGYSNDSNPFGDSNLNEKFVWRKKIERDVSQGVPLDMFSVKSEKKKQRERMAEIEKVKKRREERAIEKAQHEVEMALLARERARAEFQDWEKKEEEFHFDQSKVRSQIRLREGRIKPIDILSNLLNGSDDFDLDISEPYMVFKGLTVKEMEELRDDIKMHLDLDRATPTHIEYWEALLVVCDWELAQARKKDALDRARVRGEEPPAELLAEERGLHSSIEADVKNLLQGKTYSELEVLQSQIELQMRSGTAKVVEYWEAVIKRLHIYKAKACLKEIHAKMLHKHLQYLEPRLESEDKLEAEPSSEPKVEDDGIQDLLQDVDSDADADAQPFSPEPILYEEEADEAEEAGSFSPELLYGDENEEAIDPEEDRAILERKRITVLEEQKKRIQEAMASKPAPSEDNLELKAMKAMGAMEEGDAVLGSGAEVNLDSQVYWWHDKYRPRKPKYFNRVHTGYEWNKYNQTHYDHDNPPPKIVQGYKFNIFYPDLVDKTKAPVYTIEKDGSSGETCLIRFHAGPPYEDIAFRIVNKEWEYSHKKGFKCTFERGILHVYFNFKRYRYRR